MDSPVALLIFNRPDLTQRVFSAIRQAQPRQLFVIADGPRDEKDEKLCRQAREIASGVDWKCEVKTNFADTNLGCGRRPATGFDWLFSHVEEAIILEDDCLPARTFFSFCERLLNHYRHDSRVMHISGDNYLQSADGLKDSYYFSKYTFSCGWATWRRAWKFYDYDLKSWSAFRKEGSLESMCPDPIEAAYWENKLDTIHRKKRDDAWDYQWNYSVWTQGGLSIIPAVNLISNIGFRADATHTRTLDPRANLPTGEIEEMKHPDFMVQDRRRDAVMFDEILGGKRLRQRHTLGYRLAKPARMFRKWQKK